MSDKKWITVQILRSQKEELERLLKRNDGEDAEILGISSLQDAIKQAVADKIHNIKHQFKMLDGEYSIVEPVEK